MQKEARGKGVGMALCKAVVVAARDQDCARLQFQVQVGGLQGLASASTLSRLLQVLDWNEPAIKFYREVLHAYERVESTGKWLNYIMRRPEITSFAAKP